MSVLKLELAHFAVLVGSLDRAEFHKLAVDGATQLLRQHLTAEVVDIMCEITKHESLRGDFTTKDIPPGLYRDPQGLRLLACLAPSDPGVGPRVLPAVQSADRYQREWGAYALTQLQLDDEVLAQLVPYLRDASPEVAGRIRWLFQAQGPLPSGVVNHLVKLPLFVE